MYELALFIYAHLIFRAKMSRDYMLAWQESVEIATRLSSWNQVEFSKIIQFFEKYFNFSIIWFAYQYNDLKAVFNELYIQ